MKKLHTDLLSASAPLRLCAILLLFLTPYSVTLAEKPNFLFIISDDQAPETIHALNNDEIITPNLDRLVTGGTDESFINSHDKFFPDLAHLPFWDSLDAMGIILELEQEFEIEITEEEAETMLNPEIEWRTATVADAVVSWGRCINDIKYIKSQQSHATNG